MDASISDQLTLKTFSNTEQLDWIIQILRKQLAQPYSLYTYNNFLTNWPDLTVMAYHNNSKSTANDSSKIVGCIIGSYDTVNPKKAYIAMLVVLKQYRRLKVGRKLFEEFYKRAVDGGAVKIVLETQCINIAAQKFYENLGFFKTRRMLNYYLSGNDAFRLKLYIPQNYIKEQQQKKQAKTRKHQKEDKKQQNFQSEMVKTEKVEETQNESK